MTLSSAYIELFIRGGKSGGKCPGGNVRIPFQVIEIRLWTLRGGQLEFLVRSVGYDLHNFQDHCFCVGLIHRQQLQMLLN